MNLLDQEVKKEEPKGKKIILILLIIAVILLIISISIMVLLYGNQPKSLILSIDGSNVTIDADLLTTDEKGTNYISIQKISRLIGYEYLTGEYKQYGEDRTNTKCYLQDDDQVIQFEADSNKIYKTTPESNLDYEEYDLKNKILKSNNLLYISLEDLGVGLNLVYTYSQNENKISLETANKLVETYKAKLSEQQGAEFKDISEDYNNKKAIAYNMLIVANDSQKWGVVDRDYNTIIGNKYSSIEFVESAGTFIVSDNNKYGLISKEANTKPIIDLNYEEVKLINNEPICYQVKLEGKYAIIDKDGKPIINDVYENIGYTSQGNNEESILAIKEFGKDKENFLVVCKDKKYGLVSLTNKKNVGDCILDKIYSKIDNGERKYYIELQQKQFSLEEYIDKINTTVVNVGG